MRFKEFVVEMFFVSDLYIVGFNGVDVVCLKVVFDWVFFYVWDVIFECC